MMVPFYKSTVDVAKMDLNNVMSTVRAPWEWSYKNLR